MKRYSEYKDSGVKWIGEIPGHWKSVPFRRIAKVQCNLVHPFENLEMLQISPDSIEKDSGKIIKIKTVAEANIDSDNHRFYKGQILYSKIRPLLNKVTIAPEDGLCSADMYPISTEEKTEFIKYYMLSKAFLSSVKNIVADRVKMPKINQDELKETRFVIPPLPEQEAIVTYLDSKVAKIDEYISIAEKKIAALEELKQTIIAEAVTRGIHKDVPMKDSGVKWIGMIPEHWNMLRAKNIFERQFRPVRDCDEVVTCFRDGQVTLRKNRRIEGFTESLKEIGYQGIRKGDLVIHQMDAFAGSIGVSDSDGKGTPVYICCLPKDYKNINVYFYAYLLREMARSGFIKSLYRGIRERSSDFRFDTFSVQWLPLVPIKEQNEIVTYIEEKVANINQLCQAERSQIEKLKEYKQRLISDVVTGKVKVTND